MIKYCIFISLFNKLYSRTIQFSLVFINNAHIIMHTIEYKYLLLLNRERIRLGREKTEREWREKKKEEEEREKKRKEKEESERRLGQERETERLKDLERKKQEKVELERKLKEEREKDRQRQEVIDKLKASKGTSLSPLSLRLFYAHFRT